MNVGYGEKHFTSAALRRIQRRNLQSKESRLRYSSQNNKPKIKKQNTEEE